MNDPRGNPVATGSAAALAASERALWRMMSFYGTPLDDLDAALAADPGWRLPRLMKAGFLLSLTEPALRADALALLEFPPAREGDAGEGHAREGHAREGHAREGHAREGHAREGHAREGHAREGHAREGHAREGAHLAALRQLAAGDWDGATRAWEALLLRHPRDALALQWAHLVDFYRGDAVNLRQRVARVLPEWEEADPLHPYVLGQYAFGLEENQLYAEAEAVGRRALAGPARVPWAIHAVAHVMEMQGRHVEGSEWMARWQADWSDDNGFAGHLGWHSALFALERLDVATALRFFDSFLAAGPAQITLQRLDSASLLWRLHLLGVDLGTRWSELADGWDFSASTAGAYAFNDLHALLTLIGSGDLRRAADWIGTVAAQASGRAGDNRAVAREVGVPLMYGVLAFARGRHDEAIASLYTLRAQAARIGGSHAQRDLIDQTLIAAAAGAFDRSTGRALLNERRLAKPVTPLTAHWATALGG